MSPAAEAFAVPVDVQAVSQGGTPVSRIPVRPAGRVAGLLCALACTLALSAPAFAGDTHLHEGSFDGSATPAGGFNFPGRMAVDQSADLLYVIDTFNGAVVKLDISGSPSSPTPAAFSALGSPALDGAGAGEADETPQGGLNLSGEADIAVDNSGTATDGNVYVASESGYLYAFDDTGAFLYALDGSDPDGPDPLEGTPTASLDNPCGVAVGGDGSIYVSGSFASAVRKFTPAGGSASYVSEVATGSSACHIAVDSADDLYVNHYGGDVERYDSAGASQGVVDPGPANSVAVAPDDHVYVDRGDRIVEYDGAGAQVSAFGTGVLGFSLGVAVGGSASSVFASDVNTNTVHVFGPLVTVPEPTVEIDAVADPTATTADLSGRANPQGYATTARFEYSTDGSSWTALATHDSSTDPDLGSSNADVELTDQITGLQPNTDYQARLVAANPGGETVSSPVAFHTDPEAPAVETRNRPAEGVTTSTATVYGRINPRNSQTTYYFDYSTDPAFPPADTASAPAAQDGDAGAGGVPVTVSAQLEGLDAGTTYHYRLTAENQAGAVTGETHAVTTGKTTAAEPACPNAELRSGPSAKLPDCRAYEQVSPQDKNGADVMQWQSTTFARTDGDAVSYLSLGGFADTVGSGGGGQVQYIATRSVSGWSTRGITPTPALDAAQVLTGTTSIRAFSDDLGRALVEAYDLPGASDDSPKAINFYRLDTATRGLETLTKPLAGFPVQFNAFDLVATGASRDLRHVIFETNVKLLAEAPPGGRKLYHWDDGVLRLAGVLPDGTLPSSSALARPSGIGTWQSDTVSADGSRVAFIAPASGARQLYLRKDAATSVRVSESESSTPVTAESVVFQGATPDGRNVLFSTVSQLTDADPGGGGTALYRYRDSDDPAGDANLTFIERVSSTVDLIGLSDDGDRIYYDTPPAGRLWDGGQLKTFAEGGIGNQAVAAQTDGKGQEARVSPDGRYVAFLAPVAGSSCRVFINPDIAESCKAMYLYDAERDALACASCPPGGEGAVDSHATIVPSYRDGAGTSGPLPLRPRFLIGNGRVFFTTADSLVPEDVNGDHYDAYQFDSATGEVRLLSPGTAASDAWFADASPDGENVFITARERLVGWDVDDLADMYDVRIGGGFPGPKPQESCAGDECQGGSAAQQGPPGPGSVSLTGPGNLRRPLSFSLARIGLGQRRTLARRGRLTLRVRTGGPGVVVVSSNHSSPVRTRVPRAMTKSVVLRLDARARRRLGDGRTLRLRIVVRFRGARRAAVLNLRRAK
jgi:hypothetical protein